MYLIIIIVELKNAVNMNCDNLCNPCVTAKCLVLPVCETEGGNTLTIGTLEAETQYSVYIKNLDNGIVRAVDSTTDVNGLLIIDLWDFFPFLNHVALFRLWIEQNNNLAAINIADATVPCLNLRFNMVYDNNTLPIAPTTQEITL